MKFKTGKDLLNEILDYSDLYSPSENIYIFLYSDSGSICVYWDITNKEAKALAEKQRKTGELWSASLGPGGSIYDPPSKCSQRESNIYCCRHLVEELGIDDWISTIEYGKEEEKEENKRESKGDRTMKKLNMNEIKKAMSSFESIKPYLRLKLINTKANKELLKTAVHKKVFDLSEVVYVEVCMGSGDRVITSIYITERTCKNWGVPQELVYNSAHFNMQNEDFQYFSIENFIPVPEDNDYPMYILTNRGKKFGALAMFQKELLDEIAKKIGTDEVYIIPSSVHEVLVVSTDEQTPWEISKKIRDINKEMLDENDILSDHPYLYETKTGRIESAMQYFIEKCEMTEEELAYFGTSTYDEDYYE